MKTKLKLIFLGVLLSCYGFSQSGQSIWTELEFSKKVVKNLKIEFNPELRLLDGFKMDSYIIEGGLSYKVKKYLTLASYYRYENAWDYKKKTGEYKGQLASNRLAFDAKSGFDINRLGFQFRIRYTQGLNTTSDESEFRYRTKIDYDIKGSKFVPFASVELFHDNSITAEERSLISGSFKSINKLRYTGGLSYGINKNNDVTLFYRIQDNRVKDETTNIIGIGYSLDF
jgi:hypothetical protein